MPDQRSGRASARRITATGQCDPKTPTYVAVFCTPQTRAAALNSAAGLPGPARLVLPLERVPRAHAVRPPRRSVRRRRERRGRARDALAPGVGVRRGHEREHAGGREQHARAPGARVGTSPSSTKVAPSDSTGIDGTTIAVVRARSRRAIAAYQTIVPRYASTVPCSASSGRPGTERGELGRRAAEREPGDARA